VGLKLISETFVKHPKKIIKRQIAPIMYANSSFLATSLVSFLLRKKISPIIINAGAKPLCMSSAIFNVSKLDELIKESIKLPAKKINKKACNKQKADIIVSVI
tara:strand:+ start:1005 stop:1313 length:309 start_codon:yes stop_codon:yes gene_type:complete